MDKMHGKMLGLTQYTGLRRTMHGGWCAVYVVGDFEKGLSETMCCTKPIDSREERKVFAGAGNLFCFWVEDLQDIINHFCLEEHF